MRPRGAETGSQRCRVALRAHNRSGAKPGLSLQPNQATAKPGHGKDRTSLAELLKLLDQT